MSVRERLRNAGITGTAGAYLGSMVLKPGKSGLRGARLGAALGGLLGATNRGKRSGTVDTLAGGGDWKFSAYIEDMTLSRLPAAIQAEVLRFVDAKPKTPFVHYGMTVKELIAKADPDNLASARKAVKETDEKTLYRIVNLKTRKGTKFVLLMNDRIVDGHHFLAKAERAGLTSSLNVLDLTPARIAMVEFADRGNKSTLRDKVGIAKDVAVIGGTAAAGVGAVRGAKSLQQSLKAKLNDPEVRKLMKHGQVALRNWNRAGKVTATTAKTVGDAAAPMAAVTRGAKAGMAKVGRGMASVGRVARAMMHLAHDPRPLRAFAAENKKRREVAAASVGGGAVGALAGAAHIGGRRVAEGEPLQPGVRYVRRHKRLPLVQHEGIATGKGTVAEVYHPQGLKGSTKTHIIPRDKFAAGKGLHAIDSSGDRKAAARAKASAGKSGGKHKPFDYCIGKNNCQHYTEKMRTGTQPKVSRQWRKTAGGAAAGAAVGGGVALLAKKLQQIRSAKQAKRTEFGAAELLGGLAAIPLASRLRRPLFRAARRRLGPGSSRIVAAVPELGLPLVGGAVASGVAGKLRKKKKAEATEFGGRGQLADLDNGAYVDPLDVFVGRRKGYGKDQVKTYNRLKRYVDDVGSGRRSGRPGSMNRAAAEMKNIKDSHSSADHGQVIRSVMKKAETVQRWGGRGKGLVKDTIDKVKGKPREKDAWGREKKREWEKPWFQRKKGQILAAGAIGAGALVLRRNPGLRQKYDATKAAVQSRVNETVKNAFPGAATHAAPRSTPQQVMRKVQGAPVKRGPKVVPFPKPPNQKKRGGSGPTMLARKIRRLRQFNDAREAGWDVRDARGNSARVFAPGSKGRERREKRWHERLENERKLWTAGLGAAAAGGGAIAAKVLKFKPSLIGAAREPMRAARTRVRMPTKTAAAPPSSGTPLRMMPKPGAGKRTA